MQYDERLEKFFNAGEMRALKILQDARTTDTNSHGLTRAYALFHNAISYLIGVHPVAVAFPRITMSAYSTTWQAYKRYREVWRANFEYWRHDN